MTDTATSDVRTSRTVVRSTRAVPTADLLLFAAMMAPYVVLAAMWARSGWFPIQDQAVFDLRMQDLTGGDLPLVGAFSRYGWSHPGPVWFLTMAPFRVLGGGADWIVVGSLLWFGAGPATTAVLVRRRHGDRIAALGVAALGAMVLGAGGFALLVPWNPHVAFAWLPVFLVLCLGASSGRTTDLAAAVFVGSALVQLHVGYLVLVALPLLAALVTSADSMRPVRPREFLQRVFAGAARWWWLASAALWLPPLVEQVWHGRDGNVSKLAQFFLDGEHGDAAGWSFATRVIGGAAAHSARVVGGRGEVADAYTGWVQPVSIWWTVPFLVLVVAAFAIAVRRRSAPQVRALVVAVSVLAAGLLALAQLVGDRWPYLFVWRYAVLWFVAVVSIVVLVSGRRDRPGPDSGVADSRPSDSSRSDSTRWGTIVLAICVGVVGVLVVRMATTWTTSGVLYPAEPRIEALADDLLRSDPPEEPVSLTRFGSILVGAGDGVLRAARDAGWDVGVHPGLGYKYGDDRVVDPSTTDVWWFVTETSADTTVARIQPGAEVLAMVTPLTPEDDAALTELQTEVLAQMLDAGRGDLHDTVGSPLIGYVLSEAGLEVDQDVVERLTELNEQVERSTSCRCAVVRVPPGTPSDVRSAVESGVGTLAG